MIHEKIFEEAPTPENREKLHKVHADLSKYLHLEEEFGRKKTKLNWFQNGEGNTKLFHNRVNRKRRSQ